MADLASNVKAVISQQFDMSIDMITNDANLRENLTTDGLRRAKMTAALLERFDINITDEDTNQFKTTQDVIDYVENKLWWYSM
ncbi:hypothetical protein PENANT_c006G01002 [Penicillium antarcticum]|uniref:Acyl carrier protein n=1 Tax=Penicillium antarcticum TaxID=416450 RepID=A0A1V6QD98_9EURO|nr:hypothetical protein PENANT_c006G01002 [Penicillium antarcticum]